MKQYDEKKVYCEFEGLSTPVSLKLQVGGASSYNYIFQRIEESVMMRRKGRKFVLDASSIGGGLVCSGQACAT